MISGEELEAANNTASSRTIVKHEDNICQVFLRRRRKGRNEQKVHKTKLFDTFTVDISL